MRECFTLFRFLIFCLLIYKSTEAQNPQVDQAYWQEIWSDSEDNSLEGVEVLSMLEYLEKHPIDLNTANFSKLITSSLFKLAQAMEILEHRSVYGSFLSRYELQQIKSIPSNELIHYINYVTIGSSLEISSAVQYRELLQASWSNSFPAARGYIEDVYAGDPQQWRLQYRRRTENYDAAMLLEKDPGEKLWTPKRGPDLSSGYIEFKMKRAIQRIIIGDYRFHWGQGLLFASHDPNYSNSGLLSIKARRSGVQGNRSYVEQGFLRGISTEIGKGPWQVHLVLSTRSRDAQAEGNDLSNWNLSQGLHRSPSELDKIGQLKDRIVGGQLSYSDARLNTSIQALTRRFNRPLAVGSALYHPYRPKTSTINIIGMAAEYSHGSALLFAEWTVQNVRNSASAVCGILWHLGDSWSHALYMRSIGRGHFGLHSYPLTRWSNSAGENGFTYLIQYQKNTRSAEFKLERASKSSIGLQYPGMARHSSILINYKEDKAGQALNMQYRYQYTPILRKATIRIFDLVNKHQVRMLYTLWLHSKIRSKTSFTYQHNSAGYASALVQELRFEFKNINTKGSLQLAFSDISPKADPLFWYESSLTGQFPWVSNHQSSWSWAALAKIKLSTSLRLECKVRSSYRRIGVYRLGEPQSFGSSFEQVMGNRKHTFAMHIIWKR